MASRVEFFQA